MEILHRVLNMLPGVEYAAWCLIHGDDNVTSGVGSVEILHWVLNMLPGVGSMEMIMLHQVLDPWRYYTGC